MAHKRPVRFELNEKCTRACSINPENLPFAAEVMGWYETHQSIEFIQENSERMGRKLSVGAISRHRKHLDQVSEASQDDGEPVDHLEVLQAIIRQGAKRASEWRIGPQDTLKAMEMYYRLTQGSAVAHLMDALSNAAAQEGADEATHDAGSLSPAEEEASHVEVEAA